MGQVRIQMLGFIFLKTSIKTKFTEVDNCAVVGGEGHDVCM